MDCVALLQHRFDQIAATSMRDMPVCNPVLQVAVVGFRPWQQGSIGVLITPWFMSLILLPGEGRDWNNRSQGDAVMVRLPSGVYEFIFGDDPQLGVYGACSLFSPMHEFSDQQTALATAEVVMVSLFDEAHFSHSERQALADALAADCPGSEGRDAVANDAVSDAADPGTRPESGPEKLSRRGFITAGLAARREVGSGG